MFILKLTCMVVTITGRACDDHLGCCSMRFNLQHFMVSTHKTTAHRQIAN